MTQSTLKNKATPRAGWRFNIGLVILIIGFISPLSIPLVTSSPLPAKWKAVISGALAVGIPEVFGIVAIAIMGKSGFNSLKERFFGLIRKHGPPDRVSPTRYRVGLAMFTLPILFGWLGPYGAQHVPGYEAHRFVVSVIGDVMFFTSIFVLGGDFWDKLRALFIHQARVQVKDGQR